MTATATALVATVHDRMPVITTADHWTVWLDPDTPVGQLRAMLRPFAGETDAHAVSPLVNTVQNEGPELHAA